MSIRNPSLLRMVGAFAPSSERLAQCMTQFVHHTDVKHILEVGAGTGAITKVLIKSMTQAQRSDIVEIIPELSAFLSWRFQKFPAVKVYGGNILSFRPQKKYDVIVSSLPFNAFLPNLTRAIIDRLLMFAKDGTVVSFFEYKVLQNFAPLVFSKKRLEHYYASRTLIDRFIERFKFAEDVVKLNVPPAVVHHLRIHKTVKNHAITRGR